jgi:hypothetical protein
VPLFPSCRVALLTRFIHKLFDIQDNLLKYNSKFNNPEKQSFFCTGWKACATKFFAVWRIIRAKSEESYGLYERIGVGALNQGRTHWSAPRKKLPVVCGLVSDVEAGSDLHSSLHLGKSQR